MSVDYMLTTVDNPFDPFTQWDEWLAYDITLGYFTPGLLARVARTSPDLSDADLDFAIQSAIDEIVSQDATGLYRKVKQNDVISQ